MRALSIGAAFFAMLLSALGGCTSIEKNDSPRAPQDPKFGGVRVEMVESAPDGVFPMYVEEDYRRVDARSVLRLRFDSPVAPDQVEQTEGWKTMARVLDEIAELQTRYRALVSRAGVLSAKDEAATTAFQTDLRAYDKAFNELFDRLSDSGPSALMSKAEMGELMVRAARPPKQDPFVVLMRTIEEKRKELYRQAEAHATAASSHHVVVRAYLLPQVGDVKQLHVPGYDGLSARILAFNRYALPVPTAAELARLQAELAGAQLVQSAVLEIQANQDVIENEAKSLLRDLRERLHRLIGSYREAAGLLANAGSEDVLRALQDLNTTEATQLAESLRSLRSAGRLTETSLDAVGRHAEAVRRSLEQPSLAEVLSLIDALKRLKQALADLDNSVRQVGAGLKEVGELLPAVAEQAAGTAERHLKQRLNKLRDDTLDRISQANKSIWERLPQTKAAIEVLLTGDGALLNSTSKLSRGVAELPISEPGVIPRPLDNLQDALLNLRQSAIAPGDSVEMRVSFVPSVNGVPDLENPQKEFRYTAETRLMGWHRRFSGDLIFARAVSGPGSDKFKPNVGVSLEWHRYERDKPKSVWNRLDPGFGFHAANLDQDDDQTVELGAGINASLWNGLIRVGYGYNLGVESDRTYWWLGFGLFGALNKLNDPGASGSGQPSYAENPVP